MTVSEVAAKKLTKKCHVCKTRLKIHEGKLCSCTMMLCMKHRYKDDHDCPDGRNMAPMVKIEPLKVDKI